MDGKWIGVVVAAALLNGFALLISSEQYTAMSIRARNNLYYSLFRREVNRLRADDADAIADRVVKWLRPLVLILVNGLVIYLVTLTMAMNSGPR